ncbi:hypothetical protein IGI04_040022 [Brassica rapa subsp. trilocularis]|uniref:Uncharacterized protein n=1 Tax=Brassica rapa subsp. trilocularis TaxID=1813537 RepID=A0ABQ7KQS2_BRACM|nr:hypothetical protein IGI04_040022 [Brassica rapa subsp. trilocularis]
MEQKLQLFLRKVSLPKVVAADANPVLITRRIENTTKALAAELKKMSKEIVNSQMLYGKNLCGTIKFAALKAPGFGERKSQYLDDIAALTGAPSTPVLVSGRKRLPQLLFRRLLFPGRQGLYSLTSPALGVEVPSWVRVWGLILDPVFYGFGLVLMVDRGGPWCLVSVIAVKAQIVKVSICLRQLSVVRRKRSSEEVVSVEARYFTSSGESREMLRRRCDAAAVRPRRRCHVQLQLVVLMRSRYVRWKISVEDRFCCCDRAFVSGDIHFRFRRCRCMEAEEQMTDSV